MLPVHEILASATLVASQLCLLEGQVGVLAPGSFADLLVVEGDPTKDLGVLQRDGACLLAIMRGGRFFKNRLQ